jgi:hypothetical protein
VPPAAILSPFFTTLQVMGLPDNGKYKYSVAKPAATPQRASDSSLSFLSVDFLVEGACEFRRPLALPFDRFFIATVCDCDASSQACCSRCISGIADGALEVEQEMVQLSYSSWATSRTSSITSVMQLRTLRRVHARIARDLRLISRRGLRPKPEPSGSGTRAASEEGIHKIRRILHGRKTTYRHGLPTHDNKNPMFCIIAYSC